MKLIPTDKTFELEEEQRQEAKKHEGHNPEDHICDDCEDTWEDWCLARKNGLERPPEREPTVTLANHRADDECKCQCHFAFWACTHAQTALKNDGMPLYRVEDEEREQQEDGWKIVVPFSVVEQFEAMPEEAREEAIAAMLKQVEEQRKDQQGTMKRR